MPEKTIDVLLDEGRSFKPPKDFSRDAEIRSMEQYQEIYNASIEEPEAFWGEAAGKNLTWFRKWDDVLQYDFQKPSIRWFIGGKLNASYNCLDRHLDTPARNRAALIWESDGGEYRTFTYQQLHYEVNRFANVLKKHGISKGDRVTIYLPMVPELPIAMLACSRIGAIHSVVFGGFSAKALSNRINDSSARILITADKGVRGGRKTPLKANADEALIKCPSIEKVVVVMRSRGDVDMEPGRDSWWHDEMAADDISCYCKPEWMDAEDPLFILYTSGSTGNPKGVIHALGGYLLYANLTFRWVFDYHERDIHFCAADIGWITGHSYIVYGPLSSGATSLMFEGVPTYPHPDRFWEIVEKHRVSILYTAPTVIRALMIEDDSWVQSHDLSSLRLLGSVGEPINPEAWIWYYKMVGKERLPIVDTWWQTETGGILLTPLPGAMTLKPGSANRPFPGISPKILRDDASSAEPNEGGHLVIEKPWPGMLKGMFGDTDGKRFKEVYFSRFPGRFFTGDGARIDDDGDIWLMGRMDDVVNVSGHRIGTAEVESALESHLKVSEAAVVGYPHEVKGEAICAFIVLHGGGAFDDSLAGELQLHVKTVIGPIARPDRVLIVPGLPKTRSGKIMRRILRKISRGDTEDLGDTSTLADPSVLEALLRGAINDK